MQRSEPSEQDIAWSRAYATQAQSDLEAMDLLKRSALPECHYLHHLQMAAEKVCKAHLSLQGHDEVRRVHSYIATVFPVIARILLARVQAKKERDSWEVESIRVLARQIELLAPACHEEGSRPDNSEYPWESSARQIVVPSRHKFAQVTRDDRAMMRLTRVLREAADQYARA